MSGAQETFEALSHFFGLLQIDLNRIQVDPVFLKLTAGIRDFFL